MFHVLWITALVCWVAKPDGAGAMKTTRTASGALAFEAPAH